MPRRLAPAAVSFVLLLGLFVYLFNVPLRPTAWDGPRTKGPHEDELRSAGRFARDVRLPLARLATWRSPGQPLAATAEALLGLHALLAALRFAVLWLVLWRLGGRGWLATLGVLAAALPMLFGAPRHDEWDFGLLPFAILLTATTCTCVSWRVAVVGLPVLFVLWANGHASALLGLAWLGAVAVGRVIEWWQVRRTATTERPAVGRLLVTLALCAGAVCLTPDGWQIFPDAFRLGKNSNNYQLPAWQPIDFSKGAGMPWGYFATLAAVLAAQFLSPSALRPTALVVVLTFGFWPVLQQRGLGYWWMITPWLVVPLVACISRRDARQVGNLSYESTAPGQFDPWLRWVAFGLVGFAVVTTPAVRSLIVGPRSLNSVVSADTPARLALELTADDNNPGPHIPAFRAIVRDAYPDGRYRGAILADADQGDFLAWVLDGDNTRPVTVYSRPETFDAGIWAEAQKALDGASDWWELLGRHQVNLIVVHPGRRDKLAERLRHSAEWAIVEDAPALLVAVRRVPKLPAELQP